MKWMSYDEKQQKVAHGDVVVRRWRSHATGQMQFAMQPAHDAHNASFSVWGHAPDSEYCIIGSVFDRAGESRQRRKKTEKTD
jgi:hypothetical protein